jgi:hypothetical protein
MDDDQLDLLWKELGSALQMACHEGVDIDGRGVWEIDDEWIREVWLRITHPRNREALRSAIGTGGNPDGDRMIQEAYRQSVARSTPS